MGLIRVDGFIRNTGKTGSCISKTRRLMVAWYT